MPYGSWKCEKCNNINYPFRTKCNRQNCGAVKPSKGQKSPSEPADENDQVSRNSDKSSSLSPKQEAKSSKDKCIVM